MKRIVLPFLVLAALGAGAETLPEPTGPGELVLPPIVLEVEDLSEVRIEARLPPEEDLVPPDRRFPLPEPGSLAIGEPSLPSTSTPGHRQPRSPRRPLAIDTRAEIGVGVLRDVTAARDASRRRETRGWRSPSSTTPSTGSEATRPAPASTSATTGSPSRSR